MNKWTHEVWPSSTEAEAYEGTESSTSPAAHALLVQAGLLRPLRELSTRTDKAQKQHGFTTWAHMGLFHLLTQDMALIPTAPNTRTTQSATMMLANGYWHDRGFVRGTPEGLGMEDIRIEACDFRHTAASAAEFARMLRVVVMLVTSRWDEGTRRKEGREVFEKAQEVLTGDFRERAVAARSVALV